MIDDDIFARMGVTYINPGEYRDLLSKDEHTCVALAQTEMLSVAVRVYRVGDEYTGVIKGNIAAVGRGSVVQEIDKRFTPDSSVPHLILHKAESLKGKVNPGDEVVINYASGVGKVIPVSEDAQFAYDIDFDGNPALLDNITKFLSDASDGGRLKLSSERIAEVVGNAVTNAQHAAFREFGVERPADISVSITEHIRTLDLKQESIVLSEQLLKAYQSGYRVDKAHSVAPTVIFKGVAKTSPSHLKM